MSKHSISDGNGWWHSLRNVFVLWVQSKETGVSDAGWKKCAFAYTCVVRSCIMYILHGLHFFVNVPKKPWHLSRNVQALYFVPCIGCLITKKSNFTVKLTWWVFYWHFFFFLSFFLMSLIDVISSITLLTHALVCSAIFFSVWLGENQFFLFFLQLEILVFSSLCCVGRVQLGRVCRYCGILFVLVGSHYWSWIASMFYLLLPCI